MAKYGMSMCVLGMAEEFRGTNIAVNALWPKTGERHAIHRSRVAKWCIHQKIRIWIYLGGLN
jgi:NAD(P)-dependent dehydrogenase (short-subunit alcohol dehydrogenase family)